MMRGVPARLQQLALLRRRSKRPRFDPLDRVFWTWLAQWWPRWPEALHVVCPETVIRWHRQGFRAFWTWKSRRGRTGRPSVGSELAALVRTMALANPIWAHRASTANCSSSGSSSLSGLLPDSCRVARSHPHRPGEHSSRTRRRPRLRRLLRRADCDLSSALRVRGPIASSPQGRALQRHCIPYRCLDGAAGRRGLPARLGAALPLPRSRQRLRGRVSTTGEEHRPGRGSHRTALTLADPLL